MMGTNRCPVYIFCSLSFLITGIIHSLLLLFARNYLQVCIIWHTSKICKKKPSVVNTKDMILLQLFTNTYKVMPPENEFCRYKLSSWRLWPHLCIWLNTNSLLYTFSWVQKLFSMYNITSPTLDLFRIITYFIVYTLYSFVSVLFHTTSNFVKNLIFLTSTN